MVLKILYVVIYIYIMLLVLKKQKFGGLRSFKNSLKMNKFLFVGDNFFFKNYFFFKLLHPRLKTIKRYKFYQKHFTQKFISKTFHHPKYFKKKRKNFKNIYKLIKYSINTNPYYLVKLFLNYFRIDGSYRSLVNKRINFRDIKPYQFLPFFVRHKNPYIHKLLMIHKRHRYKRNRRFRKIHQYSYHSKKFKSFDLKTNILLDIKHIEWVSKINIYRYLKKSKVEFKKYSNVTLNSLKFGTKKIIKIDHNYRYIKLFFSKNIISNITLELLKYTNNNFNGAKLSIVPNRIKSKNCFIFNNGLFLMFAFNFQAHTQGSFKFKYRWKKKLYSFLRPNEYRKSVFLKKRKSLISHFFFKFKKRLSYYNSMRFSYSKILLKFNEVFLNKAKKLFFYSETTHNLLPYKHSIMGKEDMNKYGEVRIPRIRFRPGYQRIWRHARVAIKELLNLKYIYQYRLTRYLMRFSRFLGTYSIFSSDFSIKRVMLYSRLLPDTSTFNLFLQNRLVYINGLYASAPESIVYVNDILQLIVSRWYYIFSRWISNWSLIRLKRFKKLIFRKGSPYRYKLMKQRKTRSAHTPNWIHNIRYEFSDIKPYLEVDFFTLSAIYIYEPHYLNIFPISDVFEQRHFIYRLYNWKYIT